MNKKIIIIFILNFFATQNMIVAQEASVSNPEQLSSLGQPENTEVVPELKKSTEPEEINEVVTGTQSDVALDDITYYIKQRIEKLGIEMSPDELEKIIDQAGDFVEKESHGPRTNRHINDDTIKNIKNGFERYLKKEHPITAPQQQDEGATEKSSQIDTLIKKTAPQQSSSGQSGDLDYRQARKEIKTLVKDFIRKELKITDEKEVSINWRKTDVNVRKKLNERSSLNQEKQLIVAQPVIKAIANEAILELKAK